MDVVAQILTERPGRAEEEEYEIEDLPSAIESDELDTRKHVTLYPGDYRIFENPDGSVDPIEIPPNVSITLLPGAVVEYEEGFRDKSFKFEDQEQFSSGDTRPPGYEEVGGIYDGKVVADVDNPDYNHPLAVDPLNTNVEQRYLNPNFIGHIENVTDLNLASEWAFKTDFERSIWNLTAVNDDNDTNSTRESFRVPYENTVQFEGDNYIVLDAGLIDDSTVNNAGSNAEFGPFLNIKHKTQDDSLLDDALRNTGSQEVVQSLNLNDGHVVDAEATKAVLSIDTPGDGLETTSPRTPTTTGNVEIIHNTDGTAFPNEDKPAADDETVNRVVTDGEGHVLDMDFRQNVFGFDNGFLIRAEHLAPAQPGVWELAHEELQIDGSPVNSGTTVVQTVRPFDPPEGVETGHVTEVLTTDIVGSPDVIVSPNSDGNIKVEFAGDEQVFNTTHRFREGDQAADETDNTTFIKTLTLDKYGHLNSIGTQAVVEKLTTDPDITVSQSTGDVKVGIESLSQFTTDDLAEGGSTLYFTDERAQDAANSALSAGTDLTKNYDDAGNTITLDHANTGEDDFTGGAGTIVENISTDERGHVDSISGTTIVAGTDIDVSYNVNGNSNIEISHSNTGSDSFASSSNGTVIDTVQTDGRGHVETVKSIDLSTNHIDEGSNLYYTDERAQDATDSLLSGGNSITLTYDDSADDLSVDLDRIIDVDGTATTFFQIGANETDPVALRNSSGELQVRQGDDSGYADLRVKDLVVEGTETILNTETVSVADNKITLNSDVSDTTSPTEDAGVQINRGSATNASLLWNEGLDRWEIGLLGSEKQIVTTDQLETNIAGGTDITTSYNSTNETVTVNHANTGAADSTNTGATVIQSAQSDGRGHLTSLSTTNVVGSVSGGTDVTVSSATGDPVTVNHANTGADSASVTLPSVLTGVGTDGRGHVTSVSTSTFTTGSDLSISSVIEHNVTAAQSTGNSGGTVIQNVGTTSNGHVTSVSTKNLDDRYYTETEVNSNFDNYQSWTIEEGDGEQTTIGSGEKLEIYGGTNTTTEITSTGSETRFRVQHANTGNDSGNVSLPTVITEVTSDDRGHVTAVSSSSFSTGSDLTFNNGSEIAHSVSSGQSTGNSAGTVLQNINTTSAGHVTSVSTKNLDNRYYTESEADDRFVNESGDTMTGTLTNEDSFIAGTGPTTGLTFGNIISTVASGNGQSAIVSSTQDQTKAGFHARNRSIGHGYEFTSQDFGNFSRFLFRSRDNASFHDIIQTEMDTSSGDITTEIHNTLGTGATRQFGTVTFGSDVDINDALQTSSLNFSGGTSVNSIATSLGSPGDNSTLVTEGAIRSAVNSVASAGVTSVSGGTDISMQNGNTTGDVTVNHANTGSDQSTGNSGGTVIQDVNTDGNGHITSVGTTGLDSRYVKEGGDTMTGDLTMDTNADISFQYGEGMRLLDGGDISGVSGNDTRVLRIEDANSPDDPDGAFVITAGDNDTLLAEFFSTGVEIHAPLQLNDTGTSVTKIQASVDDPGDDSTLVTEQGIREALNNDVTSVSGGTDIAMQNGNTTGDVTVNHGNTGSDQSTGNSGETVIQNVNTDGNGHVTSVGTTGLDSRYVKESGDTMTGSLTVEDTITATNDIRSEQDVIAQFSSDRRLKTNVESIGGALDKIDEITGVKYEWTEDFRRDGTNYGFIAQEVREVLPESIKERNDGTLGLDYKQTIPLLANAIKELKRKDKEKSERIEELQERIQELT